MSADRRYALEHFDRHWAALGRTHQADHNLRPVAAVVAAVAILRQFAAASFEIGGGDVVEQQRAILQMAAGQLGFDEWLLAAQPIDAVLPRRAPQRRRDLALALIVARLLEPAAKLATARFRAARLSRRR